MSGQIKKGRKNKEREKERKKRSVKVGTLLFICSPKQSKRSFSFLTSVEPCLVCGCRLSMVRRVFAISLLVSSPFFFLLPLPLLLFPDFFVGSSGTTIVFPFSIPILLTLPSPLVSCSLLYSIHRHAQITQLFFLSHRDTKMVLFFRSGSCPMVKFVTIYG